MLSAFLTYAEFQGFWARFAPETPYGREQKDLLKLHTDPAALEAIWDRTDTALALLAELEADPVRLNRVSITSSGCPGCRWSPGTATAKWSCSSSRSSCTTTRPWPNFWARRSGPPSAGPAAPRASASC